MRCIIACLATVLLSMIGLGPGVCAPEPIANVIPGEGRAVGLLEWVEADFIGKIREKIDPDQCDLILAGPGGPVPGKLDYSDERLKFVPAGTQRIKMDDEAVTRNRDDISVRFEGTSIGAGVIQGPGWHRVELGRGWRPAAGPL